MTSQFPQYADNNPPRFNVPITEYATIKLKLYISKPIFKVAVAAAERVEKMDGIEYVEILDNTSLVPLKSFDDKIEEFNKMYKLPCPDSIGFHALGESPFKRLTNFMHTIQKEVNEGDDILENLGKAIDSGRNGEVAEYQPIDALVDLADWHCDMMIYCASELRKIGIRSADILDIIMASNMSKLGADGLPIYDAAGKVMKGPNYWKPEPMIRRFLEAQIRLKLQAEGQRLP
jgi:predicted HAD superfamily Cof-like phosphohydrolase